MVYLRSLAVVSFHIPHSLITEFYFCGKIDDISLDHAREHINIDKDTHSQRKRAKNTHTPHRKFPSFFHTVEKNRNLEKTLDDYAYNSENVKCYRKPD